jgi:hypothetical protein
MCGEAEVCCRKGGYDFSVSECLTGTTMTFGMEYWQASQRGAGLRAEWNQEGAEECLAALRQVAKDCDGDPNEVEACSRVYAPLAAPGERCVLDLECIATSAGPGSCVRATVYDHEGTCGTVLVKGVGEPCDNTFNPCAKDLRCDGDTGVCTPKLAIGSPCQQPWDCVDGATCHDGTCTALRADGEMCEDYFECISDRCFSHECNSTNVGVFCSD